MIRYIKGNIFESDAEGLVNTVNTVGVMGKGIALQFKKAFPNNFKKYLDACKSERFKIGKVLVCKDSNLNSGEKWIINFPTKRDWRKPSEYSFIEKGLDDLILAIEEYNIKSVAIPPLGSGNGGLDWVKVKCIIENKLKQLDIDIWVYEPTARIKEYMKKERVKLTNARALLLYVLFDLVKNGEYVSEFSSEKVCYFLQKFGAKLYFKLEFKPNYYGPYSGKVRFVLLALNGSYVMGYSDMNKKPFDPLTLVPDGYDTVKEFVENNHELKLIANKTISFLNGYYSDFALELLSSIDYISSKSNTFDRQIIIDQLNNWSNRKRSLIKNPQHIDISLSHLQTVSC